MARYLILGLVLLSGCVAGEVRVKLDADVKAMVADVGALAELVKPAGGIYPPGGAGGVADGADLTLGDVTLDKIVLDQANAGVEIFRTAAGEIGVGASMDGVTPDGALNLSGGGTATALKLGGGSQSTPAVTLGDADTGIWAFSAGRIDFAVSAVNALSIGTANVDFSKHAKIVDDKAVKFGSGEDRFMQGESGTLADDTASEFVAIQSALGDAGGTVLTYTVKLTDATGVRAARTGTLTVTTLDGAAGITASIGDVGQTAEESGTTTWAFAVTTTDDGDLEITCQTTTTLTPTAIAISWTANVSGDVTLVVTP